MPKSSKPNTKHLPKGLTIVYEDRDILIADKPAGLLTSSTKLERIKTAHYSLTDYVRKGYSKSFKQLYLVHRLDRDASGLLVFAKSVDAKYFLIEHWHETKKTYLAVVHGKIGKASDTISSYLVENETSYNVYSTRDTTLGKLSHTAYKVLKETRDYSLLEIDLLTGRKHQIRVHLSELGHPIVGDQRYGKKQDPQKRLALLALHIAFTHPHSQKQLAFTAKVPTYFQQLVGHWEFDSEATKKPSNDHKPVRLDSLKF